MTDAPQKSAARKLIGDFAPKMVALTEDVLFGDVWARPELPVRDRSLITVASLITGLAEGHVRDHGGQRGFRRSMRWTTPAWVARA